MKFIVVSSSAKIAKNGRPFVSANVINEKREVQSITIWGASSPLARKEVFQGPIKEKDGFLSVSFAELVAYKDQEFIDSVKDMLPKEDNVTESQWNSLIEQSMAFCVKDWACKINPVLKKLYGLYSKHTAAKVNHHAFEGGLLTHTYQVVNYLNAIYPLVNFPVQYDCALVGACFHDFGKVREYSGANFDYTEDMFLLGHPFMGAEAVAKIMRKEEISGEDIERVQHVILSHHGKLEYGSPVVPCTGEAFLVSHCDSLSGTGQAFADTPNMTKSFVLGTSVIK